jgi:hypothetical protein
LSTKGYLEEEPPNEKQLNIFITYCEAMIQFLEVHHHGGIDCQDTLQILTLHTEDALWFPWFREKLQLDTNFLEKEHNDLNDTIKQWEEVSGILQEASTYILQLMVQFKSPTKDVKALLGSLLECVKTLQNILLPHLAVQSYKLLYLTLQRAKKILSRSTFLRSLLKNRKLRIRL